MGIDLQCLEWLVLAKPCPHGCYANETSQAAVWILGGFVEAAFIAETTIWRSLIGPASRRGSCMMRSHCRQQYSAANVFD